MENSLSSMFKSQWLPKANQSYSPRIDGNPPTRTETLPYGGGSYNPSGGAVIAPAPVFTGATSNPVNDNQLQMPKEYINPETGELYSDEEYANNVATTLPRNKGGDVPTYAGDAMTNPDESAAGLTKRATNMNNARNDISVGETDPYDITEGGKIVYSPEERKAIQNAYAGIYDPALNDVFARLKEKQAEDERLAAREERIFATNEAIRQWKATTGSKSGSGGDDDGIETEFTPTQIHKGAGVAGMTIEAFEGLTDEVKNYYVNPSFMPFSSIDEAVQPHYLAPANFDGEYEEVPAYKAMAAYYKAVEEGDYPAEDLLAFIKGSKKMGEDVKMHAASLVPAGPTKEEKKGSGFSLGNLKSWKDYFNL